MLGQLLPSACEFHCLTLHSEDRLEWCLDTSWTPLMSAWARLRASLSPSSRNCPSDTLTWIGGVHLFTRRLDATWGSSECSGFNDNSWHSMFSLSGDRQGAMEMSNSCHAPIYYCYMCDVIFHFKGCEPSERMIRMVQSNLNYPNPFAISESIVVRISKKFG